MLGTSLNDYGHSGEDCYDIERHEWLFTRTLGRRERFNVLEGPTLTLAADSTRAAPIIFHSARARTQAVRELTSTYPEFAAATSLLPSHLQTTGIIEELYTAYDPLASDLLAFGHATDIDRSFSRQHLKRIPIVALPGGSAKDSVILVCLNQEQLEWHGDEKFKIRSTTLRNGERVTWPGHRGPIKQLQFSPMIPKSRTWLAVRYLGATVFFQPTFHLNQFNPRSILPIEQEAAGSGSFRFVLNEALVLPIEQTGGAGHIDVAFNPFTAYQVAVLDRQGYWSIWTIERHGPQKKLWDLCLSTSGCIDENQDDNAGSNDALKDGFGKISWVRDSNTLFAVSRTSFALFGLQGSTKRLVVPGLIIAENAERILDARGDPLDNAYIFVVTSTRILCLEVYANSSSEGVNTSSGAKVLLSWRHFRSPQDYSLRVSLNKTTDSTTIVLSSRITGLTTVNTLFRSSSTPSLSLSLSDTCLFDLNNKGDVLQAESLDVSHYGKQRSIASIVLRELLYETKTIGGFNSLVCRHRENRTTFYQLIVLDNDLNINEYLLTNHTGWPPNPPDIKRLVANLKSSWEITPEYFVVPNVSRDDHLDRLPMTTQSGFQKSPHHLSKINKGFLFYEEQWTLNMEWLQRHVQRAGGKDSCNFKDALKTVRSQIQASSSDSRLTSKSLFELLDIDSAIGDVDIASNDLRDTLRSLPYQELDNVNQNPNIVSNVLTTSLCRSLGIGEYIELSQLYDHIVRFWISPLPSRLPGRVRFMTEQLTREIAAQLCLASYKIISRNPSKNGLDKGQESQNQNKARFPLRESLSAISNPQRSGGISTVISNTMEDAAKSPQRTLSTAEPITSLHSKSLTISTATTESLVSRRIRSQVPHMVPQTDADPTISKIMAHWDEGLDPGQYDWERVERRNAIAEGGSEADVPVQKRKNRRVEKQRKRLEEAAVGPSSQLAPREGKSSQPEERFVTQEGTQATQPIVKSQAEPRLQGSQKSFAKRQTSKRKAGF